MLQTTHLSNSHALKPNPDSETASNERTAEHHTEQRPKQNK